MVKVERVNPPDDVKMVITAPKVAWVNIAMALGSAEKEYVGDTRDLIDAIRRECKGMT